MVCVHARMCHVHVSVHGGQERVLDSLKLELWAIVIHEM